MQLGIAGLAQSGKTTVFQALAGGQGLAMPVGQRKAWEPNVAVVKVPDHRLEQLAAIAHPAKITPAEVRYVDTPTSPGGERARESVAITMLRESDALLWVVRAFENQSVPHPAGTVDPVRDVATLAADLAVWDLSVIERRLERLPKEIASSRAGLPERAGYEHEQELMRRFHTSLERGEPVRAHALDPADEKRLRGYGFLTQKPTLVLLNTGDDPLPEAELERVRAALPYPHTMVEQLAGKLELELSEMGPEEAETFRQELGLAAPARERVIQASYALLGLVSFLTEGPDEVRAWTVADGTPAPIAAGVIHSSFTQNFIRAEVVRWDQYVEHGGWAGAKKAGLVRSEGRDYRVRDGDTIVFLVGK